MTTQIHQGTAKIYQFRPRTEATRSSAQFPNKLNADTKNIKVTAVLCGESWYHEAAIQGGDNSRKS